MLKIDNVYKNYGKVNALSGFSVDIKKGELFGLIGPNGAGKTTLFKIIAGLIVADEGSVIIGENDISKNRKIISSLVGYMPDTFGVYDNLKVVEYMEFFCSAYNIYDGDIKRKINDLLLCVELLDKSEIYVDQLSRGMKQRLCLARTLLPDPDVLVLDEPYAGLDVYNRMEMKKLLRMLCDNGKTILISSHILNEMTDMCTSIGVIKDGKMVLNGDMDTIIEKVNNTNPLLIKAVEEFNTALDILKKDENVKSIAISGSKVMIEYTGGKKEEGMLLKKLVDNNVVISFFGREQKNLERLFMDMTEKEKKIL